MKQVSNADEQMGEAHNIAPTLFEVVELLLFSRWLFVLDIDSFGFFYFMPTIDWLNLDTILFSFIKRLNRAIYENNSEKKKKKKKNDHTSLGAELAA